MPRPHGALVSPYQRTSLTLLSHLAAVNRQQHGLCADYVDYIVAVVPEPLSTKPSHCCGCCMMMLCADYIREPGAISGLTVMLGDRPGPRPPFLRKFFFDRASLVV